jgi:Carboxypeptidase regulatory-like domain/TonB-dependent Receptor Plug Domain
MKRIFRLFSFVLAVSAILCAQGVLAQVDRGTISGHVTDSSGSILQGAQVVLQPAGITVVSDQQGAYYINNLLPGSYTLTVSYVGFALFTKSVDITAGHAITVDAKMELSSQKDEVIVTAHAASGEAEAVNREKTADNLVNIMTSEVITSLPNATIADAVGRLPGVTLERDEGEGKYIQVRSLEPRLTNATIDGVNVPSPEPGVREIKFDAMPADLVESVEVNKTLQANMDGDGIGGSVNIVTKTAGERPTIDLFGSGGTTPIMGNRNVVLASGTVGERFGKDKRWGALIGGSYDWNGRGIHDIEPVPETSATTNTSVVAGELPVARTTNSAKDRTSTFAGFTQAFGILAISGCTHSPTTPREFSSSIPTAAAQTQMALPPLVALARRISVNPIVCQSLTSAASFSGVSTF